MLIGSQLSTNMLRSFFSARFLLVSPEKTAPDFGFLKCWEIFPGWKRVKPGASRWRKCDEVLRLVRLKHLDDVIGSPSWTLKCNGDVPPGVAVRESSSIIVRSFCWGQYFEMAPNFPDTSCWSFIWMGCFYGHLWLFFFWKLRGISHWPVAFVSSQPAIVGGWRGPGPNRHDQIRNLCHSPRDLNAIALFNFELTQHGTAPKASFHHRSGNP